MTSFASLYGVIRRNYIMTMWYAAFIGFVIYLALTGELVGEAGVKWPLAIAGSCLVVLASIRIHSMVGKYPTREHIRQIRRPLWHSALLSNIGFSILFLANPEWSLLSLLPLNIGLLPAYYGFAAFGFHMYEAGYYQRLPWGQMGKDLLVGYGGVGVIALTFLT